MEPTPEKTHVVVELTDDQFEALRNVVREAVRDWITMEHIELVQARVKVIHELRLLVDKTDDVKQRKKLIDQIMNKASMIASTYY